MKEWIALPVALVLTIGLAVALAGRLKSEPKTAPSPSDSAISSVVQTFNEEQGEHWRRVEGDLEAGYVNLGDYHDYRKSDARPAKEPFLATMEIRAQDKDGLLYTADIYAGNHPTRRAAP